MPPSATTTGCTGSPSQRQAISSDAIWPPWCKQNGLPNDKTPSRTLRAIWDDMFEWCSELPWLTPINPLDECPRAAGTDSHLLAEPCRHSSDRSIVLRQELAPSRCGWHRWLPRLRRACPSAGLDEAADGKCRTGQASSCTLSLRPFCTIVLAR
jgi:hypothetical protein